MDKGFFNGLFDFNKDGKLDPLERAMDFGAFVNLMENEATDKKSDDAQKDAKGK